MERMYIALKPIGRVRSHIKNTPKPEYDWSDVVSEIEVLPLWQEGLFGLEQYSHITVIYWAHKATDRTKMALRVRYRGDPALPEVGVFASRSPYRPNPLCIKVAKLLSVDRNILQVRNLDALDGTPVVDIKPFIPTNDAPINAHVPDWNQHNHENTEHTAHI
jgi:tRNA-Thr(GGU) m(6)t(6)A37 methyltransferase TsaA